MLFNLIRNFKLIDKLIQKNLSPQECWRTERDINLADLAISNPRGLKIKKNVWSQICD